MPRSGSGIYTQPFPNVVTDTTIESAVYNGFTRDVEKTFNEPTPIVAGGTGATSPAGAADSLNVLPLTGGTLTGALTIETGDLTLEDGDLVLENGGVAVTADNAVLALAKKLSGQISAVVGSLLTATRWRLLLGDATAETGGNTGSDFQLERYNDAGVLIDAPLKISRRLGTVTVSGAPAAHTPILAINKTSNGTASSIHGQFNGLVRWGLSLTDGDIESGGNSGSNLRINRYDDLGNFINAPFVIKRSDGVVTITGTPPDQKPILVINKVSGTGTQACAIQGQTATLTRWHMALGDGQPEVGGNTGSNFKLHRHDDSGAFIDFSMVQQRNNALFAVTGAALKPGGGSWGDTSDARIKTVVGEYAQGLDAVRQLQPVIYRYKGNDIQFPDVTHRQRAAKGQPDHGSMHYAVAKEGKEFIGLIAQQAERSMPELVTQVKAEIDGIAVNDYRVMDNGPILYALVNAVKELAARVEALEAARR